MTPIAAAIIAAIALGLGGIVFIWFARRAESIGKASLMWPKALGQIVKNDLKHGPKGSTRADLSYAYAVAGKSYTGTVASFSGSTNATDSKRIVEKYPAGSQVSVAYDPSDPSSAVLEVGSSRTVGMNIFGIVMLLAAVGLLALALFQR